MKIHPQYFPLSSTSFLPQQKWNGLVHVLKDLCIVLLSQLLEWATSHNFRFLEKIALRKVVDWDKKSLVDPSFCVLRESIASAWKKLCDKVWGLWHFLICPSAPYTYAHTETHTQTSSALLLAAPKSYNKWLHSSTVVLPASCTQLVTKLIEVPSAFFVS